MHLAVTYFLFLANVFGDGKDRVNCSQWTKDGENLWFAFQSHPRNS